MTDLNTAELRAQLEGDAGLVFKAFWHLNEAQRDQVLALLDRVDELEGALRRLINSDLRVADLDIASLALDARGEKSPESQKEKNQ